MSDVLYRAIMSAIEDAKKNPQSWVHDFELVTEWHEFRKGGVTIKKRAKGLGAWVFSVSEGSKNLFEYDAPECLKDALDCLFKVVYMGAISGREDFIAARIKAACERTDAGIKIVASEGKRVK